MNTAARLKILKWFVGVGVVILLCCWGLDVYNAILTKSSRTSALATTGATQNQPLTMNTTEWHGIGTPPGKRINAWPMKDVTYMIRLDKDPRRVHEIRPGSSLTQKALVDVGNSKYIEFQMSPGQLIASCEVIWEIKDL